MKILVKRFLLTIFSILFFAPQILFAVPSDVLFTMENWMQFSANDLPQPLPAITIIDQTGGNITQTHGVAIMLPKDMDILWDKNITQLQLNNQPISVFYSKNVKNLIIPISKTFIAGETVKITGQRVRIYGKGAGYQELKLDINGDAIGDVGSGNGIQIDATNIATDGLAPYAITALTYKVGTSSVSLSWENPADPDFVEIALKRTITHTDQKTVSNVIIDGLYSSYTDSAVSKGDIIEYEFKTKDNVGNLSEVVKISVQILEQQTDEKKQEPVQEDVEKASEVETTSVQISILDSVTQSDIDTVLAKYSDIANDTSNLKAIVYLVKLEVLKGVKGKLNLSKKLTYLKFVNIAGKAFSVEKKGTYLKTFKDLDYLSSNVPGYKKITRKKAFKTFLKIKNMDESAAKDIALMSELKGIATRADIVNWIVKFLDIKDSLIF